MTDTHRDGGYRLVAREHHPAQLGHVESPHTIPCPFCGRRERLVYVEVWDPVPGFDSWTEGGAPPYVMQLRPAVRVHPDCDGREMNGVFLCLPKDTIKDAKHTTYERIGLPGMPA